jgi:hypothetical protein
MPNYRNLMISATILLIIGWLGLILLLRTTLPTVGPRWLFFFLWTVAITGTSLPFIWLLHRRFSTNEEVPASNLLRQGLFIGLYASTCIWLQINRSLNIWLALFLAGGLTAIEWFLRILERSRWRPGR